jgi:hypothetical protein
MHWSKTPVLTWVDAAGRGSAFELWLMCDPPRAHACCSDNMSPASGRLSANNYAYLLRPVGSKE